MAGAIAHDEARAYAMGVAMGLQDTLQGSGHPTFVKPMKQLHVTGPFWLGLPTRFCREHLPKRDERITLVDEAGDETGAIYLAAHRMGISAGWRGFALAHGLVVGDCLLFELVEQTKIKVHIVRQSAYYENQG